MRVYGRLIMIVLALLIGGVASAREPTGFLGVEVKDTTKEDADRLGWEAPRGVKVVKPHEGGPAARAGILADDVIISLQGMEVENTERFFISIGNKGAGTQVRLRLLRSGKERTVTVTLARRPGELAPAKNDGPILQLDTGGHRALIEGLAFTPDGMQLVSASDDKIIRIWDWQAAKTIRTMRGQVGPGPEGKIYAMALSPDGRWIATGGWLAGLREDQQAIRLHDAATGRLVTLLQTHAKAVFALAFSPDSKRLISGGGDSTAIIWDVEGRKSLHRLRGHKSYITAVAFTGDGARAVSASDDSTLRLWRVRDGGLIAEMQGFTKLRSLAVRPSDSMIASGDASGEIRLWDGNTGQYLRTLANQGGNASSLRFSPDGLELLSTCGYGGDCKHTQHAWEVATGKELAAFTKHSNSVFDAAVSPDGRLVATGGFNGDVQVWDLKTGETKHVLAGTGAPRWAVGFSADGQRIGWGSRVANSTGATPINNRGPIEYQLRLPGAGAPLGQPESLDASQGSDFLRAVAAHNRTSLAHRQGGSYGYDNAILDVQKDGQTIISLERGSTDGYGHNAYSFTPDGQIIISGGGNGVLTAYDLKGGRLGDFVGHESDVWAVTPSPDGRFLVSGGADQTVRLWNLKTRELIVTLFNGADGEWVLWTPQGYYTGSPGADKIVGWQINKGPDQAADYVGAEQLRQHLNRPDIVERAITLASAEQAVREAPGTTFQLADLLSRPLPRADATRSEPAFRDCAQCPEMVAVPAGEFIMGSVAHSPHKVTFARPFAVSKFDVTFAEWDACVEAGGCKHKPDDRGWARGALPVINVSWDDVTNEYLPWLVRVTGKPYRLLTEAEWEYAARGETSASVDQTTASGGIDVAKAMGNCDACGSSLDSGRSALAGSFPDNAFGLHDMLGNVNQWVQDCWHPNYDGAPSDGSAWETSCAAGSPRVGRGGSRYASPHGLRAANRYGFSTALRYNDVGFRLARPLVQDEVMERPAPPKASQPTIGLAPTPASDPATLTKSNLAVAPFPKTTAATDRMDVVLQGWLGADVLDVTKVEADKLGWDAPHGAKVGVVAPGSPAENAGLKWGDMILSIDRTVVDTSSDVDAAIAAKRPGDGLRLQILSRARERYVTLTLAERPKAPVVQQHDKPQLMLDTGGHMAVIEGLAFTPDGMQLVSASDDKVIRIWDWQAGKTIRTIRGQVGPDDEGTTYAMALSSDGRWLATGGWMKASGEAGYVIRLFDFSTGRLIALLRGHIDAVSALAFSRDGKRLISGSGDNTAIIWDVEGRKLLHRLQGHTSYITAVAFTPDGARAVTGSDDTTLRLWRVGDGELIADMQGHTKFIRRALAVRSSDSMIASGDGTGEIRLWDGNTGQYLRTLANQGGQSGSLIFSPDGLSLLSTCGYTGCNETQRVWEVATGKQIVAYAKHDNIVVATAANPDGRLVATGGFNGDVQVWDLKTGETKHVLAGTGAPRWAVGFSADGQRIGWGSRVANSTGATPINNRGPIEYQLRLPGAGAPLGQPESLDASQGSDFLRAVAAHNRTSLAHRQGGSYGYDDAILDLKKDGQTIMSLERGSPDGYGHNAYSFTPDGQIIISGGGNGVLTAYDLKGGRLGDFVGHESDVWAVTPSPDGRFLVSGGADQTVRLWNLKTRELIVTLFNGADGEWVLWTPQGYYTGSPGADKIVGWQINKGPDQAADYVGAEQLRQHLNRPDIVERAITLASAEQAVREAPGTTFQLADLLSRPLPRFKIVAPAPAATMRGGRTTLSIAIEATYDPIKAIRVQVNGLQIKELTPDTGSGGFLPGEQLLDVPLAKGHNEVRVTLTNAIGEKAGTLSITHDGEGDLDKRGTLYIVAIGVDKYPGLTKSCGNTASCDLRFAGADARALVEAAEKRLAPSHTNVVKRVLVNGADGSDSPTTTNILDAVDLLKQAKETDTVLLFISGHGINDGPNYRFLPTNAEWTGSGLRGATVVPWQVLQEAVETAKGRRILLIDTCHSGNAYNQRVGNAAYHANIIAYTATRFDQEALEDAKLGHGLFTYAMVEGLDGKGRIGAKRQMSTKELADYVVKRVNQLAKTMNGEQEPQYFKGRDAEDYVFARW